MVSHEDLSAVPRTEVRKQTIENTTMMENTCNPTARGVEAGGFLIVTV